MAQPRQYAPAFAPVVQGIFLKSFCQPVPGRGSDSRNGKVGTESLAETFNALIPLRRRIAELVDASRERGAGNWIRTEGVEDVVFLPLSSPSAGRRSGPDPQEP